MQTEVYKDTETNTSSENEVTFNHNKVASSILNRNQIIYIEEQDAFYIYKDNYYQKFRVGQIGKEIKRVVGNKFSKHTQAEVINSLKADAIIKFEDLNSSSLLNLKNGLFDIASETLIPHSPQVKSTIRLNVSYNKDAKCPKWRKAISEILEDEGKISVFQEYCGLCLTKETRYAKALFLIGEGANGKSTLLALLEHILTSLNVSSIPLEMLKNNNYVANLFNKLVNISFETNSKSEVYDATFKSIVTGDLMTADAKYGHPFDFRPYCKLIYALNNMPRVSDKTLSFYRRLLILRFNKTFEGASDNKGLKEELLTELDGIFLWCLEGLRNLRQRGDFKPTEEMEREVKDYQRENNAVLVFAEEKCNIDPKASTTKQILYDTFKIWCEENGHKPASQRHFTNDLKKAYPSLKDGRTEEARFLEGICLK